MISPIGGLDLWVVDALVGKFSLAFEGVDMFAFDSSVVKDCDH